MNAGSALMPDNLPRVPVRQGAHFIGDHVVERQDLGRHDPACPDRLVAEGPLASPAEVAAAVAAAEAALDGWRELGIVLRAAFLAEAASLFSQRRESLAEAIVAENGKTIVEARGEVARAGDTLAFHAAQAWSSQAIEYASVTLGERISVRRQPLGVVGLITPWNFPAAIPIWKLAPALLWGNTVVWKPPGVTPGLDRLLLECLLDTDIPKGVLNMVEGDASAGVALVNDDRVAAISFTGSTAAGAEVQRVASARGARVQLELGGHGPLVVLPGADPAWAAAEIVRGSMASAGQKCTATRRAIVHRDLYATVLARVVELVAGLRLGHGGDDATDVGPLVSAEAVEAAVRAVELAVTQGATLEIGGSAATDVHLRGGHFFEPTVLSDVDSESKIARDEVFAPVLSFLGFDDVEEAIQLANRTDFGLAAAVFGGDAGTVDKVVNRIEAGVVHVGHATTGSSGLQMHVPLTSFGDSSRGTTAEQGIAAADFFTRTKVVYS